MTPRSQQQLSVLIMSTLAFTVCFAVWMMFAVIGVPLKAQLGLNETQFGLLVAMPVLTGSLIRLPLGMWTDKFGGRIVFFVLMLSTVIPIWVMEYATAFWHFLVIGLFVGLAGGSFSVGIAYCARWYEKARQGMAMGVFGAGNSGAALTKLVAPSIVVAYGWTMVPKVYAIAMLVTAILFWFFTYDDPEHKVPAHVTVMDQIRALTDVANSYGLKTHLDGARFANACAALDCTPAEMTWKAGIDGVSFGGTKNGCLGVEAVVFFDPAQAWELELRRKRGAHLFSKHRFLSAQMNAYVTDGLWLRLAERANVRAAELAEGIKTVPGASLEAEPAGNMIFAHIPRGAHKRAMAAGAKYYLFPFNASLDGPEDETIRCRFVCDWSCDGETVQRLLGLLRG